jgi:hypothetical protein
MPDWMPQLLLFVFATHMPFFAWRWRRSGEARHAATTLTFALLTALYALQVFAPEWSWRGLPLYRWVRIPALLAAALSLGLLLRHALRGLRRG